MNLLKAQDIKRRGMAAIEEALDHGPVHILKYNRPAAVVLSEADYQALLSTSQSHTVGAVRDWLQHYGGDRGRADIDTQWRQERDAWDPA